VASLGGAGSAGQRVELARERSFGIKALKIFASLPGPFLGAGDFEPSLVKNDAKLLL
jgi:hypothetical protein